MLSSTLAGIPLSNCIYNASGPRTGSSAAMSKIAASASGAVLAKSATIKSQKGNPLPRTWHADAPSDSPSVASLNSEGLPNAGIDYYLSDSTINETMATSKENEKKPYMVSISGKTLDDNLFMLKEIIKRKNEGAAIAAVELNLACPNIIGKPIIGFDFPQMDSVLKAVSDLYKKAMKNSEQKLIIGVKMPPYFDTPHFEEAASKLNKYKDCISYVASINTIGNALAIDTYSEMPVIASKGGFAGLSGPAVKYTALANVRQMRRLLDPSIDVVGVGGVQSGQDVFDLILCGATAVQIGTAHWIEGPKCFDRISNELEVLMKEKGYSSISQFQNKLKDWTKEGASASRQYRKNLKMEQSTTSEDANKDKKNSNVFFSDALTNVMFMIVTVLLVHHKISILNIDNDIDECVSKGDDFYFNISVVLTLAVGLLILTR